jgi:hypothetical protein
MICSAFLRRQPAEIGVRHDGARGNPNGRDSLDYDHDNDNDGNGTAAGIAA